MGFKRHYFKQYNFMLTKISGEINDNDLSLHVEDMNQAADGLINLKELADCREITIINLTTQGTTNNASDENNKPGSKLAILTPVDNVMILAMARAYQIFSEDNRESVGLFQDFDEAMVWLTDDNAIEKKALTLLINST